MACSVDHQVNPASVLRDEMYSHLQDRFIYGLKKLLLTYCAKRHYGKRFKYASIINCTRNKDLAFVLYDTFFHVLYYVSC